jgi:uncharacterized protein (TIGR03435 family)
MKLVASVLLILCAPGMGFAQANSKDLAFEVASVRQAAGPRSQLSSSGTAKATGVASVREHPDQIAYRNITLKSLLMKAYDLKPFEISGPSWIESEHYDVLAKIPEGASKEQVPAMLQNLLAERFRMTMHSEIREQPGYVLGVGKNGSKLKPSSNEHPLGSGFTTTQTGQTEMKLGGETMAQFSAFLSSRLDRPVVDETGLRGGYDIVMHLEGSPFQNGPDLSSSLLTAVRELGLQLDAKKLPLKHLVIDKAERIPTEN